MTNSKPTALRRAIEKGELQVVEVLECRKGSDIDIDDDIQVGMQRILP